MTAQTIKATRRSFWTRAAMLLAAFGLIGGASIVSSPSAHAASAYCTSLIGEKYHIVGSCSPATNRVYVNIGYTCYFDTLPHSVMVYVGASGKSFRTQDVCPTGSAVTSVWLNG